MSTADDPVQAEITRNGRLPVYRIAIVRHISSYGTWLAFSRAHAEKRARKKLAWYQRKFGPPRERWTVQP